MVSKVLHIIFAFTILIAFESHGQFGANFSVVSNKGCNAFTVTVNDLSGAPEENVVVYDYGDGTEETEDTFHIYSSPGIYQIRQIVASGDPRIITKSIEVVEPREPEFVLSNCKGTEAFIYMTDTLYNAYWVDWGDGDAVKVQPGQIVTHDYGSLGSFDVSVKGLMDKNIGADDLANLNCTETTRTLQVIADIEPGEITAIEVLDDASIQLGYVIGNGTAYFLEVSENGTSSFTNVGIISSANHPNGFLVNSDNFPALNTAANYYCFRLVATDFCDGDQTASDIACSINLNVTPENNQNRLDWLTETTDLNTYEVFKGGASIQTTALNTYSDTDVECGLAYCYRIVMTENNGLQSISNIRCDTAFSEDIPPPIENVSASVEDNRVVVTWPEVLPEPDFYTILKAENDSPFPETPVEQNSFDDENAVADRNRYSYQVSYENKCGQESPPTLASPVFLSATSGASLQWSGYLGWQNGPSSYVLEKYSEDGSLLAAVDLGQDIAYEETDFENLPQKVIYRVVANPVDALLPEVNSNFLEMIFPSTVVFPNAFTPNGDGLNDFFSFKGKYVTYYKLSVFTRWGELIFETEERDSGWDGTFNSKPVPSGVYIFKAEFEDEMGMQFTKQGEIFLIR